jgi:predicted transposase YbfD/YdcC
MAWNGVTDMAKKTVIDQTIAVFREIVKKYGISVPENGVPRKPVLKLLQLFQGIGDGRVQGKVVYPLHEIIMTAFLAIMAGADTFVDIANFGAANKELLKECFYIKHGIPAHDTFRRVFSIIDPALLQTATVTFLTDNIKLMKRAFSIENEGMRQYCVDGKTARGTGRLKGLPQEVRQLHTLHVYDRTDGICIISKAVDDKTNEIPVARDVLRSLDLRDVVVTFDALNTQRDTVDAIIEKKGHYVAALKGNHPELYGEAKTFFTPERLKRIASGKSNYFECREKLHNRIETRKYYISTNVSWLVQLNDWKGLKSLIYYSLHTEDVNSGKVTDEARCYISSMSDVVLCANAVRGQWEVENLLHWHLDVNFSEDWTEIIDRVAYQNKSLMNKMALSLLKLIAPLLKSSVRASRKLVGWNISILYNAFRALDEDLLADAMLNVKMKA